MEGEGEGEKKKYGLEVRVQLLPPKKEQLRRPSLVRPPGFFTDYDNDIDVNREIAHQQTVNRTLMAIEEQKRKAIEEDPSVFDYDGVYERMKDGNVCPLAEDRQQKELMGQPTPTSVRPDSTCKKASRGDNFSVQEDLLLVMAWINVSSDDCDKQKPYWLRMCEYFFQHKDFTSDRSEKSLNQRWSKIRHATRRFCRCHAQIESRQKTGVKEYDKISSAKKLYKELNKNKFLFEHCWNILRHQPKWLNDSKKKIPTQEYKTATSSPDMSSPSVPETPVDLRDDEVLSTSSVQIERQSEKKAEKRKIEERVNDSRNSSLQILLGELTNEKKEWNAKKIEIFEKMLDLDKEKHRSEQMREEERIMLIDTNGMRPHLAEFYHRRQMEIIGRGSSIS